MLTTDYAEPGVGPDADHDRDVHRELRWYWHDHAFPRRGWRERVRIERHNAAVLEGHLGGWRPDAVCWWGMGGMSLALIERVRRARVPAVGVVGDEWMVWGPRADRWLRPFRKRPALARVAERLTGLPTRPDLATAATWLFNSDHVRRASLIAQPRLQRAQVAYPGIDDALFTAAEPRDWEGRLLYLGRFDQRKGVHVAIRALALLPSDTTLVLQGSGDTDYLRSIGDAASELGVSGRVVFSARPRSDLRDVYAEADVVLFPVQWEEPWGLVPIEAMAVGRPVVASGTGGSAEYLEHEVNALLYSPRDSAEALAEAVRRLASDAGLRDRLRVAGKRTASRFTESAYNAEIAAAIETAVTSRHAGSISE